MKTKIIHLLFSDVSFGTHEYGFIRRNSWENADDEDSRYKAHLRAQDVDARVWDGKVMIRG
jgi:hypothetical protein